MADRILILVGVVTLIVLTWGLVRGWRALSIRRLRNLRPFGDLVPIGRPAIVAFSTPTCRECLTRQAPALAQLSHDLADSATVRTLSALEHPALVDQIGILTVPATVVIDADGRIRHINLGYTSSEALHSQAAGLTGI